MPSPAHFHSTQVFKRKQKRRIEDGERGEGISAETNLARFKHKCQHVLAFIKKVVQNQMRHLPGSKPTAQNRAETITVTETRH